MLLIGCTSSRDEGPNNLIWIIPVAIVAGLLILGLIILLIIKLFLLILVSETSYWLYGITCIV